MDASSGINILIPKLFYKNMGAAMMLASIQKAFNMHFGEEHHFAVPVGGSNSPEEISKAGLLRLLGRRLSLLAPSGASFQQFYLAYGLIHPKNIHLVLDSGGYQFADTWIKQHWRKEHKAQESQYLQFKRRAVPIIFMPQSFGPFESEAAKDKVKRILPLADLVFVREAQSLEYLKELTGILPTYKMAPDFTPLLSSSISLEVRHFVKDKICLVPNANFISRKKDSDYVAYLAKLIDYFTQIEEGIFFLNHEHNQDFEIMQDAIKLAGKSIRIFEGLSGEQCKGIIGSSKLLISGRYHALVSGLSQGIPSIANAWAPKYEGLMQYYGCQQNLIETNAEAVIEAAEFMLNPNTYLQQQNLLEAGSVRHKQENEAMWQLIFDLIRSRI
jgi:hypothetical protein